MRVFRKNGVAVFAILCGLLLAVTEVRAGEVMPPAPTRYFNDYANVTQPATRERVNQQLEQFEKETSSQIVVAVFPKMQTDSSIEDYTRRVAEAWGVGRKNKNNGVVLFVFIADRKAYIQVGYGLEGAIPDAIAKRIVAEQLVPRFRAGDYDGGLSAAAAGLMQAARGEYKGTGRTVAQSRGGARTAWPFIIFFALFFLVVVSSLRRRRGTVYGRRSSGWGPIIWTGGGGGGGWSGGGGGGGFSGGGGSFGGGGAGGSW